MSTWLPADSRLLDSTCPLPLDHPFTPRQAEVWGVSRATLRTLVQRGLVRRVVRGVYAVLQAPGDLEFRARALHLVVAPDSVVTSRSAAWLHGVDVLPRDARTTVVPVSVHRRPGRRVRRPGVASGERMLLPSDVVEVHGLAVTSPLRTACDLGRELWRFDALAALDQFLRLGVDSAELLAEVGRFKGYRGVIQLRTLAPLADPRAESQPESALRLHWMDADLPSPVPQHWVCDDVGNPVYRIDIAAPEVRYGAEYYGAAHHDGEAARARDRERLAWLEARGWVIDVFKSRDVYGAEGRARPRLREGWLRARGALEAGTTYPAA
ncbi:type IV toxin-antitoxin system AbiEi family antitoxin domain-containing protein [Nocardioides ferulae]|uniref:type IV toxin-antitoxin system AbiEi family antitoxin domain-containing protein n=1 Tax=Nocardioides ferulae TaxID=2340821 RepID=UPI000EB095BB|nr:type IV toxin-antitoxin system AbiEi family antitoxin domain-containing protein [Nocardioides ferulae]